VAEHVCAEVPHRQFMFTLPKRLRTEPFLKPWEQEVFALLLAKGRITDEVMADMGFWKHSGFSVDQSGWSKAEPKSKAVPDVSGRQFQPVSP